MPNDDKPAPDPDKLWLAFLDAANSADWDACDKSIDELLDLIERDGPYPRDWDYLKHWPGGRSLGVSKMGEALVGFSRFADALRRRKEELADLAALAKRVEGNGWHRLTRKWDKAELPGHMDGYPMIYVAEDCGFLCPTCANSTECRNADPESDKQWDVAAGEVYWEGPPRPCDNCNKPIESAYGDPDEKEVGDAPA